MGMELVGWKFAIASLLILGMARLTLSDVEEMRGDVREKKDKEDVPLEALKYLGRFGHLRPPEGPFSLVDSFETGLRSFQSWVGINTSGALDKATLEAMHKPRCGVTDWATSGEVVQVELGHKEKKSREKRFTFYESDFFRDIFNIINPKMRPSSTPGSRWRSLDLTYRISVYPIKSKLSKAEVDEQIAAAFKLWSDVTDLSFTPRSYGSVHIDIQFQSRHHGDADSFDGRGGVLAHSYFPIFGGAVHFDDDEHWVTSAREPGTHLLHVAAHEFGHALGLPHIPGDSTALMGPTIDDKMVYIVELGQADIAAIQQLYGPKTSKTLTTSVPSPSSSPVVGLNQPWDPQASKPSLCSGGPPDCLVGGEQGGWAIKGDKVWRLDEQGEPFGPSKNISDIFPGLPREPDAGFTWHNGLTFVFKGYQYYRFRNYTLEPGFPRRISQGFSGLPSYVELAFLRGRHIYFVKGNKFWIFSPASRPPISKPIHLPKELVGVTHGLTLPGNRTFLFSSDKYWRLLPGSIAVDKYARPGYPRRTRDWWWSCGQRQSIVGELRDRNGEGEMELRNSFAERLRDRDHVDVVGELRVASDAKTHPSQLPLQLFLVLSSIQAVSTSFK